MNKIGIIGIGNLLRNDDGVGIILLEKLIENKKKLPKGIEYVDGGTSGMGLLHQLARFDIVFVIDAVDFNGTPGELRLFKPEDVVNRKYNLSISTHDIDFLKIVKLSKKLKEKPEIFIFGIQPRDTSFSKGLSPELQQKINYILDSLISKIRTTLKKMSKD